MIALIIIGIRLYFKLRDGFLLHPRHYRSLLPTHATLQKLRRLLTHVECRMLHDARNCCVNELGMIIGFAIPHPTMPRDFSIFDFHARDSCICGIEKKNKIDTKTSCFTRAYELRIK